MSEARTLSDGRSIGFAEFGSAAGTPVLALHGTPGSHLKFAPAHTAARSCNVRLIAIDRWGYGNSTTPRSEPSLEVYADDLAELADALGVNRFSLLGISGGGPFAAVTAGRLGRRVKRLALIAPVGPIAGEPNLVMDPVHEFTFRVVPRLPGLSAAAFQLYRGLLRVAPHLGARLAGARGPPADKEILSNPSAAASLADAFRLGLRHGTGGPSIDLRLFARRWPPIALSCEARMWLGTLDRNVPRAAALRLANTHGIPVTELEGAGHFWFARHADVVLDWLSETKRTA